MSNNNDDIFAEIELELDDFMLNPSIDEALQKLPQSDEHTPLTEQTKIWNRFQDIIKDQSSSQQNLALLSFIKSPVSANLQKKALHNLHKAVQKAVQNDNIEISGWKEIAAATKSGNEDEIFAIAENLLNSPKNDLDSLKIFEGLVFKPKQGFQLIKSFDFTDRFIANPKPYLNLLTAITKSCPYLEQSEAYLETIYTTLKQTSENKKLKEAVDEAADKIYDIREKNAIKNISETYQFLRQCHGVKSQGETSAPHALHSKGTTNSL